MVESLRTERGPRQRIVAHLGEIRPGAIGRPDSIAKLRNLG